MINEPKDYHFAFKIFLTGNFSVGKSSLIYKFIDSTFTEITPLTLGFDFKIKNIQIDEKIVKMIIWDTAERQRFGFISPNYYKGNHGICFVYDICDRKSFEDIKQQNAKVDKYCDQKTVKFLIANKIDKITQRKVSKDQGQDCAISLNMRYFQTSSITGENVEQMFFELAKTIKQNPLNQQHKNVSKMIDKDEKNKKFKSSCI